MYPTIFTMTFIGCNHWRNIGVIVLLRKTIHLTTPTPLMLGILDDTLLLHARVAHRHMSGIPAAISVSIRSTWDSSSSFHECAPHSMEHCIQNKDFSFTTSFYLFVDNHSPYGPSNRCKEPHYRLYTSLQ
jgi:hypothetical protein